MSKKTWIASGGNYYNETLPIAEEGLQPGVYELNFDSYQGKFFLREISENFELPKKLYGVHDSFIERVKITYRNISGNLGVLLKGLKGTGKTIAAKKIANDLNLPVILVNQQYNDMGPFISGIDQDIILLFDEFEKTYDFYNDDDNNIPGLLTLLDGIHTSKFKRLFLMTTNDIYLPPTLTSRPSRIRYIKDFSDLDKETVIEILNDVLNNKDHIEPLINIIKNLRYITVDIVKSMGEEVNIYDTTEKELFDEFNVESGAQRFEIHLVGKNKNKLINAYSEIDLERYKVGHDFYQSDRLWGRVVKIITKDRTLIVKSEEDKLFKFKFTRADYLHQKFDENVEQRKRSLEKIIFTSFGKQFTSEQLAKAMSKPLTMQVQ